MKRAKMLFPVLISDENLLAAIETVNRTHRWSLHHRPNKTVAWVERTKPERVAQLRSIFIHGFHPVLPKKRLIYDPSANKVREIHEPKLWPDQYVHHALIQVLQKPIMRGMDHWCCGSIPGRGTSYGIKAIKKWMKNDPQGTRYCAELDIHHFYQSLTPEVVMEQMRNIVKDVEVLRIIDETLRDGVPIGNYCSQWFANAVLQPLDHKIREEMHVKHYVRYMDNFTLFAPSKRILQRAVRDTEKWLNAHGMRLKSNWQVFPTSARMPNAMGYRYGRGYTLPRKRPVLRFKRMCRRAKKRIESGQQPTLHQAQSILSRGGYLKHCNGHRILRAWTDPVGEGRLKRIVRCESQKSAEFYKLRSGEFASLCSF